MTLVMLGGECVAAEHVVRLRINGGHGMSAGAGNAVVVATLDNGIEFRVAEFRFREAYLSGEYEVEAETLEEACALAEKARESMRNEINAALLGSDSAARWSDPRSR